MNIENDEYEISNQKKNIYNTRVSKKETHTVRSYQIENELIEKIEMIADAGVRFVFINDAIRSYLSYLEQLDDEFDKDDEVAIENFENHDEDDITKKESQNYVEGERTHINHSFSTRTRMIQRARHRKEKGV